MCKMFQLYSAASYRLKARRFTHCVVIIGRVEGDAPGGRCGRATGECLRLQVDNLQLLRQLDPVPDEPSGPGPSPYFHHVDRF